jgi:hypothetical protein
MKKTKISETAGGVRLECLTWDGRAIVRNFFVSGSGPCGGYVREWQQDGSAEQACERLGSTGATLVSTHEGLLALVRKEWRAAVRRERESV